MPASTTTAEVERNGQPPSPAEAEPELMRVSVNLDDYPLREKIDLELALGESLGDLFPANRTLPYRSLVGLAWLTKRRQYQRGTVEFQFFTFNKFVDSGDENWTGYRPDPTPPGGSRGDEPERSPGSSATTPASA